MASAIEGCYCTVPFQAKHLKQKHCMKCPDSDLPSPASAPIIQDGSKNEIAFSISIVSHGHSQLVISLLKDLSRLNRADMEVILTWNLPTEIDYIDPKNYPFRLTSIRNTHSKGFASNHNAAFRYSTGKNFVILNPDIEIENDPFNDMREIIEKYPDSVCAPRIVNAQNELEDSARSFPTPLSLIKKVVAKAMRKKIPVEKLREYDGLLSPDWIAGMFMVIPRAVYEKLGGLDERYFLYYEDVHFCALARCNNIAVYVSKTATATHHARRESHRNFRFLNWHLKSALRFFTSKAYMTVCLRRMRACFS